MRYLIICIAVSLFFGCSSKDSFYTQRKKAKKEFERVLIEDRINPELFQGPFLNLTIDNYTFFEWHSLVPHKGAITIGVWFDDNGRMGVNSTGEKKNWAFVHGTRDTEINNAILSRLFDIKPNETSKLTIGNLTNTERENIVRFILIKNALIEHYFKIGGYPSSLEDLNLFPKNIRDKKGHQFGYYTSGNKYVLLGAWGNNEEWDVNDSLRKSMLNSDHEFLNKVDDDLFVKFIPVRM